MSTLDELIDCIDDPEDDGTQTYQIVDKLVAAGDLSLIPALTSQLGRFLDDGNFYGRDVIADVLAGLAASKRSRCWSAPRPRDLGDDQDSLGATIVDLVEMARADAHPVLDALLADEDDAVGRIATELRNYLGNRLRRVDAQKT
ncbi:hypothetical protein ACIBF5_28715 [Micromonospora sp. NPDC050417]|uniref:hypothetical protein n=1 Tax=Micromonospora sp. NPDC050417 TaxID=3364280 RepID=UPI0037A457C4